LMSNIRPYFKKIWLATYSGGCSGDILCFVSKEDSSSLYLYFTIEQDLFFEYVMKGAKGTKMPRGDKGWIMEYPVLLPSNKEINHFGQLIKSIVQQINVKKDEIELLKSFSRLILSKMSKVDTLQTEQVI
jgi:type I restriction enzyme S subunit